MLCVMWKSSRARLAPPSPLVVLPVLALLLVGLSGCTDEGQQGSQGGGAPSDTATGSAQSLQERAAPYELRYRRVAGDIRKARGRGTLRAISKPVRAWIDAGFVNGPWPREAYGDAFVPFGRDITATAHKDADLLTLQSVGGSFVQVVPERRQVGVSVTGVRGRVVGATARVNVRVLGLSRAGQRTEVSVRGDVYLTKVQSHGWKIFGYRLDRWVDRGAMTRSNPEPGGRSAGKPGGESGAKSAGKTAGKSGAKPGGKPDNKGQSRGGS